MIRCQSRKWPTGGRWGFPYSKCTYEFLPARDRNPTSSTSLFVSFSFLFPCSLLHTHARAIFSRAQDPLTSPVPKNSAPLFLHVRRNLQFTTYRIVFCLNDFMDHFSHQMQPVVRACRSIISCSVCPKSTASRAQCVSPASRMKDPE